MRKLTLAALLIIFAAAANAQFTKGDKYLGGSFSIDVTNLDLGDGDIENFSVSLSPSFLKFKTDRRATGFKISAGYTKGRNANAGNSYEVNIWSFGAGIFGQKYFPLGKGFYLMTEYGLNGFTSFGNQRYYSTAPSDYTDLNSYGANIYFTPAVGYKLTDRLLLGLNFSNLARLDYIHETRAHTSGGLTSKSRHNYLRLLSSANNSTLGSLGVSFAWKLR